MQLCGSLQHVCKYCNSLEDFACTGKLWMEKVCGILSAHCSKNLCFVDSKGDFYKQIHRIMISYKQVNEVKINYYFLCFEVFLILQWCL